jgi:hypothetical protein
MITVSLLGGIALCGIVLMLLEVHNAPEGVEDENGFHIAWHNNRPGLADVSCVWRSAAETDASQTTSRAHAA